MNKQICIHTAVSVSDKLRVASGDKLLLKSWKIVVTVWFTWRRGHHDSGIVVPFLSISFLPTHTHITFTKTHTAINQFTSFHKSVLKHITLSLHLVSGF